MYDDDGETPNAFEKGEYELLTFKSELNSDELTINFNSNQGKYKTKPGSRNISLVIHQLSKKPKKLFISDEKIKITQSESSKAYWDKDKKTFVFLRALRGEKVFARKGTKFRIKRINLLNTFINFAISQPALCKEDAHLYRNL